jgi:predicted metal-dependent hydrolase
MGDLHIGNTSIPYSVREGPRTKRRHIVVTTNLVEVVVPAGQQDTASEFINSRKQWVFEKWTEVNEAASRQESIGTGRLVSGAKVLFRGRRLRLTVIDTDGPARLEYRSAFTLYRPTGTSPEELQNLLNNWLRLRVKEDVAVYVRRYTTKLFVAPAGIRIIDLKHIWGSCGEGGVIHLNWRLVHAPKPVLEYAVVHELCHLIHRNHSPEFWGLVEELLPGYQERKGWLEKNEGLLEGVGGGGEVVIATG